MQDPVSGKNLFQNPDPVVKAPDPGSGTLSRANKITAELDWGGGRGKRTQGSTFNKISLKYTKLV
jgi:hypothetical protein